MLSKNKRISRKLFKENISKKRYFNSKHFSIQVTPLNTARFAVSVSKKISKKAVARNKIRRRVYAMIKKLIPKIEPGLYLIIARPGAENIKGEELKNELNLLFESC